MTNTVLFRQIIARLVCFLACVGFMSTTISAHSSSTSIREGGVSAPPQLESFFLASDSLYYSNDFTTSLPPARIVQNLEPAAQEVMQDMRTLTWKQYKLLSVYIRALFADGQLGTANRLFTDFYHAAVEHENEIILVYATKLLADICYMEALLPEAMSLYSRALRQLDKVSGEQITYIELFADIHFALLDIRLEKYNWADMQQVYAHLNALDYSLNKLPVEFRKSIFLIKTHLALEQIDQQQAQKQLAYLEESFEGESQPLAEYFIPFLKARYYSLANDSTQAMANLHKTVDAYQGLSLSHMQQQLFDRKFDEITRRAHADSAAREALHYVSPQTEHIDDTAHAALTSMIELYKKDLKRYEFQQFKQYYIRRFMVVSSIVLLLVVCILFVYFEQKKVHAHLTRVLTEEENAAAEAQVNKSRFISNMSHEIRTPLNAIVGFSDLVTDEDISSSELKENATLILANAERLLQRIDEMIDLAVLESPDSTFQLKSTYAMTVCGNVVNSLNVNDNMPVKIKLETTAKQVRVMTDPKRLQQAIGYILDNAIEYTKTGTITLAVDLRDESTLQFVITDTGIPIPEGKEEDLFTHGEPINEQRQSAGLGLLIARKIIEKLGGQLTLDSNYTEGARFIFTHPVHIS